MASRRNVSGNGHRCPIGAITGGGVGRIISGLRLALGLHGQCAEVKTVWTW